MRNIAAILMLVLVAGCASAPPLNWNDPSVVAPRVKVTRDDFKKVTHWDGPAIELRREFGSSLVSLRAWKGDKGSASYQVYVSDHVRDDWAFYYRIDDADGVALPTIKIDQKVDSCRGGVCWMYEDVAGNLSREYLEKHRTDGLRLQVSGKAGKVVVAVPAGYVRAFLERVPE